MSKVISINDDVIAIGTDNGGIKEVRRSDLNFEPKVGDLVSLFESETKTIVTKEEPVAQSNENTSGINVNISNNNNSNNAGYNNGYAVGGKVVSKVAYVLLAFFLGGLGVHKFYAGRTGAGVVYLLFCWTGIPAFIAFIDAIIGLTKPSDSNGNIVV